MHKKGSSGIRLGYLAALAFIFAIMGHTLLCGLMMLVAIFLEKDEWFGRQTMQALLLCLVFQAISWIFSGFSIGYDWFDLLNILNSVFNVIKVICNVLLFLLGIIGIYNVLKDKEADLPVLSGIAYKAYGKSRPVYASQNHMQYPQQPMGAPHYQYPPVQQQPPVQQPPVQQPPVQQAPVQQQPPYMPQTPPTETQQSSQQSPYAAPPSPPPAPPVQTPVDAPHPPMDQRPDQPTE